MKYTTKAKQTQLVGGIKIEPKGGDLTDQQLKAVKEDPWGRELIRKSVLVIDGVKPSDIKDEPAEKVTKVDSNEQPEAAKVDIPIPGHGGQEK